MALMLIRMLLAALMAGSAADQRFPKLSSDPFILAALQANGSLIPFAVYDGTKWQGAWPAPSEKSAASIASVASMETIPKDWTHGLPIPEQWRVWLASGTAHEVRIRRPSFVDSNCSQNWVLETDFPAMLASCRNCCPIEIVGLAVSSDRDVWRARPGLPAFFPAEALQQHLEVLEPRDAGGPLTPRLHATGAWKVGEWNDPPYYVEASRVIPEARTPQSGLHRGCAGISLFRAWFRLNSTGQPAFASREWEPTDCDTKGAYSYVPLGLIDINKVQYAVVQRNSWESQDYGVLRIGSDSVTTMVMTAIR